jgi:putative endonuclease
MSDPHDRPQPLSALIARPGTSHSQDTGRAAEALAARWLERRGWRVLERNWRSGHKEIDLVVARAGIVAFVEVKSRSRRGFGHPLDAITRAKRRDLEHAARAWVARSRVSASEFRFDAVWVVGEPGGECEIGHVPNAWRL